MLISSLQLSANVIFGAAPHRKSEFLYFYVKVLSQTPASFQCDETLKMGGGDFCCVLVSDVFCKGDP